jgi:hypothetical protein
MSNMQAEVYAAFRAIDVPEDKAVKAAEALSRRDDDVAALKSDVALLKWMTGTGIGLTLILLGSVLTMWIKLGEIGAQVAQLAHAVATLHQ